jgi:diguanylate cyclase (GGDEF)-like protein
MAPEAAEFECPSLRGSASKHVTPAARPSWRAQLPVIAAAVIGVVLSTTATVFVWRWEQGVADREFTSIAGDHFLTLQNGLNEYLNKLVALRALFESADHVTRQEFEIFASRLLHGQKAIQNFSWVPRVTHSERVAHERAGVQQGLSGYHVKAVLPDDRIMRSPQREEYLPIFYSTVERTSQIYGFDLLSQDVLVQRLGRARDNDTLSAVPDFILHSREGQVHGFLFSLPVYRPGQPATTVEERRRNLMGFAHGAFVTAEAIEYILTTSTTARGLDVYLFLADAAPDAAPLHMHNSRLRQWPVVPRTQAQLASSRHALGELKAGDARWRLVAIPFEGGPLATRHDRSWLLLLAGLLLTAAVVLYLRSSVRHAQRLQLANDEISNLARKDALTGLANRRAFNECLAAWFATCRRDRRQFCVLYFDLDHFKDVNDTLGHPIGDLLLRQAAGRVQRVVRPADIVARFGGDEFAILQADADAAAAAGLAERVNDVLARPYRLDGNEVHVTASIGIAQYIENLATTDALIMQADVALYRAKEDGRNCFRFHNADLDRDVYERVTTADELRRAVERGELRLLYQPQMELRSGRVVGVEALLRWQHPVRGLLSPASFIPLAERTGTIIALGEWAFQEACRQMKAWRELGIAPGLIAVNASASQFRTAAGLEDFLAATLNKWSLEPSAMEIELTESVLMDVTKQQSECLDRLRRLGLRIAIDDFGTGYSSLNYLTNYPVNRLKIAQELMFGVIAHPRNATVVRAAIRLADELGIECIAEGVETEEQVAFLVAAGCSQAQGFYFSTPVDAERMTQLLKARGAGREPAKPRLEIVAG